MDLIGEIQIRPFWNPNRCCQPGTTPAVRHRTMLQETSRTFQSLVHQPAAQQEVDKVGDGTACQSHCVAHTLVTIGRAIQHHPRYKQRHTPCSMEDGGTKGQDGHIIAAHHLPIAGLLQTLQCMIHTCLLSVKETCCFPRYLYSRCADVYQVDR